MRIDLDRAAAFYRLLYGREQKRGKNGVTFAFRNGSRLELQPTRYVFGEGRPRIVRFGLRVEPFDRAAVEAGIAQLGGTVVAGEKRALRLRDVDGIELELVS